MDAIKSDEDEDGATAVTIFATFGARAEQQSDSLDLCYYQSQSHGKQSETMHAPTLKVDIQKPSSALNFENDILPMVNAALQTLPIPVIYDPEKHFLMTPSPELTYLLLKSATTGYHKLTELNMANWKYSCKHVCVAIVSKVIYHA
jgi:hypothetical protein